MQSLWRKPHSKISFRDVFYNEKRYDFFGEIRDIKSEIKRSTILTPVIEGISYE